MVSKPELFEDLDYLSGMVSDRTRVINVAILAVWWGKFVGQDGGASLSWWDKLLGREPTIGLSLASLMWPALFAFLSLLTDFLQYAVLYIIRRHLVLASIEKKKIDNFRYDRRHWTYRARDVLFYGKQALLVISLVWFLALLVPLALRG